jgi:hypothetical protein
MRLAAKQSCAEGDLEAANDSTGSDAPPAVGHTSGTNAAVSPAMMAAPQRPLNMAILILQRQVSDTSYIPSHSAGCKSTYSISGVPNGVLQCYSICYYSIHNIHHMPLVAVHIEACLSDQLHGYVLVRSYSAL